MKNKIYYYLSNIILGIYLILYLPIFVLVKNIIPESTIQFGIVVNNTMSRISIIIVVIIIILKMIFNGKKLDINKNNKILGIVIFILELLILFFLNTMIRFA